jgi:hypothetical protein
VPEKWRTAVWTKNYVGLLSRVQTKAAASDETQL